MNHRTHTSQRGFTLFYALLVSSLMLALSLAVFNITYKELTLSAGARDSATAFYAADAGLECALFWDLQHTTISSPAFGFYGDSLASGLVGYWRFDEGTGDEAIDWSGHGNTGDLTGAAWSTDARVGEGSLLFDGLGSNVSVPDSDSISVTDEFTITAWVNPTDFTVFNSIISKSAVNRAKPYDLYTMTGTGRVRFFTGDGSGASNFVESLASLDQGEWNHVAVTKNGSTGRIFINGAASGSGTFNVAAEDNDGPLLIGTRDDGIPKMKGGLDDIRIYNRVLSDFEIGQIASRVSNVVFTDPIEEETAGVVCAGANITTPAEGWDPDNGWDVSTTTSAATTTFDLSFPGGRCATVYVLKDISTTTIISRGYSTCRDVPRRVERAIRAIY